MKFLVGIVSRFYLLWSMLYRWIQEPKGKADVKPYSSLKELEDVLQRTTWVKDGARQMWDAIGSPKRFQYLLDKNIVPDSGRDCDEFAAYAYEVLKTHPIEGVELVGCMSVSWYKDERGGRGHNVCLLKVEGNYAHIGNWGLYSGFANLRLCIKSILKNRKLMGWSIWKYPWGMIRYDSILPAD